MTARIVPFPRPPATEVAFRSEPCEVVIFPVIPRPEPLSAVEMAAGMELMRRVELACPPGTAQTIAAALQLRRWCGSWEQALLAFFHGRVGVRADRGVAVPVGTPEHGLG